MSNECTFTAPLKSAVHNFLCIHSTGVSILIAENYSPYQLATFWKYYFMASVHIPRDHVEIIASMTGCEPEWVSKLHYNKKAQANS